jgi:hypothetical protein
MAAVIDRQLGELDARFGAVRSCALPSGSTLVTVEDVALPPGWSTTRTTVRFLIPVGYPFAALDCFWADDSLRLSSGAVPQNAGAGNVIPETSEQGLWFSWHLEGAWDANRDTLSSWMNSIIDRLRRPQ